ncbi:hypothetical protein B2J88_51250 [Rhodococcus sp. SRB_17]|nr:hypothetical protein [Rhodococcus sp. SRB_17]
MTVRHRPDILHIEQYSAGRTALPTSPRAALLTSNESPYPMLDDIRDAVISSLRQAHRYPDPSNAALTRALAGRWNVQPDRISVDSGSSSIIRNITAACAGPDSTVVIPWPSFSIYEQSALIAGATPVRVPLDGDYRIDLDAVLSAIDDRTSLVFLCLPNNPTSTTVSHSRLRSFMESVPPDLLVVIDECYRDFTTDPDAASGQRLLHLFPNILLVKSFSKAAGLAGLRIGFALSSPDVAELLRTVTPPFATSAVAQAAALASLDARAVSAVESRITATVSERERVYRELLSARVDVVDSQTNFHYLPRHRNAPHTVERLRQRGVHVRLTGPTDIRITVGARSDNDLLLAHTELLLND